MTKRILNPAKSESQKFLEKISSIPQGDFQNKNNPHHNNDGKIKIKTPTKILKRSEVKQEETKNSGTTPSTNSPENTADNDKNSSLDENVKRSADVVPTSTSTDSEHFQTKSELYFKAKERIFSENETGINDSCMVFNKDTSNSTNNNGPLLQQNHIGPVYNTLNDRQMFEQFKFLCENSHLMTEHAHVDKTNSFYRKFLNLSPSQTSTISSNRPPPPPPSQVGYPSSLVHYHNHINPTILPNLPQSNINYNSTINFDPLYYPATTVENNIRPNLTGSFMAQNLHIENAPYRNLVSQYNRNHSNNSFDIIFPKKLLTDTPENPTHKKIILHQQQIHSQQLHKNNTIRKQ